MCIGSECKKFLCSFVSPTVHSSNAKHPLEKTLLRTEDEVCLVFKVSYEQNSYELGTVGFRLDPV